MSGSGANGKIVYSGRFDFLVDPKRRVQIPAKWRPADPEQEFTLMLWPPRGENAERCLVVMTPPIMERMLEEIGKDSFFDEEGESLRRALSERSLPVSLDSAGRICLPEKMARTAGIDKEAVLVGLLDRGFQIWSPERYDPQRTRDSATLPSHTKTSTQAST